MYKSLFINTIRIFTAAIATLVSTSCERDSVIDVEQGVVTPVMTAYFYEDSSVVVNAYSSVSFYSSTNYQALTNAIITIDKNNKFTQMVAADSGAISMTFNGLRVNTGDTITVNVSCDEGNLSATTVMLPAVDFTVTNTLNDSIVDCVVRIMDSNIATDYFQLKLFADDELVDCYYYDDIFESVFATSEQLLGLFTDNDFNSRVRYVRFAFNLKDALRADGTNATLRLRLYHHTYDYYQYLSSIQGAFASTVLPVLGQTNCYTNVTGGYGIVSGLSFSEKILEIEN